MTAAHVNHAHLAPTAVPDKLQARTLRTIRRQQIRQAALDGATEVFVARGYHAATMDEIARSAGYSKPVLYNQFSSKLDLYLAVLQEHADALANSVQQALYASTTNRHRLSAAVQAYFDFVDHETQGFRLVFDSDLPSEPSVQWRVGRATDVCVNAVAEIVSDDTEMNPHQARLIASCLVGASQFAARYWLETGRAIPKQEAVRTVIGLCWGGLSRVPLHRFEHEVPSGGG